MKEAAEKLIELMRLCVTKKEAGAAGNFQGILNQSRQMFDTTFKMWAGRSPELQAYITEAQNLQMRGARIIPKPGKTAQSGPVVSSRLNMGAAFDFQAKKKKQRQKGVVVKSEIPPAQPEEPISEIPAPEVAVEELPDIDTEMVQSLLNTTPAKFRDRFGGVEGLKTFGKDLFGMDFEGEDNYVEIVKTLKAKLRETLPG